MARRERVDETPADHTIAVRFIRRGDLGRVSARDVVVLDDPDLTASDAAQLIERRVSAVIFTGPALSGRVRATGISVLSDAGIPLLESAGTGIYAALHDGDLVELDGSALKAQSETVAEATLLTPDDVASRLATAAEQEGNQIAVFTASALAAIEADGTLISGASLPALDTDLTGKVAVVMARGPGSKEQLASIKEFIERAEPVLVGVEGGADELIEAGLTPAVLVGDLLMMSDALLGSGAEVVVQTPAAALVDRDRLARLAPRHLIVAADHLRSEDLALLMTARAGASAVIGIGIDGGLGDFLEHGSPSDSASFLTRLELSGKLLAPAALEPLRRRERHFPTKTVVAIVALLVIAAGLLISPLGDEPRARASSAWDALTSHSEQGSNGSDLAYISAREHKLVGGALTGKAVTIVRLPGAPDTTALAKAITAAGGQSSGTISVTANLLGSGGQKARGDLAAALLDPAKSDGIVEAVSSLTNEQMINTDTAPSSADAVIIVGNSAGAAERDLAEAFGKYGKVVVALTSPAPSTAVPVSKAVSSTTDITNAYGRVLAIEALSALFDGHAGAYGNGNGRSGAV